MLWRALWAASALAMGVGASNACAQTPEACGAGFTKFRERCIRDEVCEPPKVLLGGICFDPPVSGGGGGSPAEYIEWMRSQPDAWKRLKDRFGPGVVTQQDLEKVVQKALDQKVLGPSAETEKSGVQNSGAGLFTPPAGLLDSKTKGTTPALLEDLVKKNKQGVGTGSGLSPTPDPSALDTFIKKSKKAKKADTGTGAGSDFGTIAPGNGALDPAAVERLKDEHPALQPPD